MINILDVAKQPKTGGMIVDGLQHSYGWSVHVTRLRAEIPANFDPSANLAAEEYTVQCVDDVAGNLAAKFYTFDAPGSGNYYAWFNVGGVSPDPKTLVDANGDPLIPVLQLRVGVPIVINPDDTAATIAAALQTAVDGLTSISAAVVGDTVTVTNANNGSTFGIINGGTDFNFNIITEGKSGEFIYDFKYIDQFGDDYDVELFSGVISVKDARDGDYLNVYVVDKDNILGIGEKPVLDEYVLGFYLNGESGYENHSFTTPDKAKLLPKGVYVRVAYKTFDASNANKVIIKGRLDGFRNSRL